MAVNNLNSGVGIQPTIVDAKGDLIAATANDAVNRLAVGTNGQVLVADSGETTGLKWNNPGTVGGLVHIETQTFTSVASVSLTTDTFTTTYDNYLIIFKLGAVTSDGSISLKMRASGSDSSANYYYSYRGLTSGNGVFDAAASNTTAGFLLKEMDAGSSAKPTFTRIELYNPKIAQPTSIIIQSSFSLTNGTPAAWSGGGVHTPSTAYDSASFIANAGNISGSITVFGVKI